jgi:hypothetical protein
MAFASWNCRNRTALFGTVMTVPPVNVRFLGIKRFATSLAMSVGFLQSVFRIILLTLPRTVYNAFVSDKAFWRNIKMYSANRAVSIENLYSGCHTYLTLTTSMMTLYHNIEAK